MANSEDVKPDVAVNHDKTEGGIFGFLIMVNKLRARL